MLDNITVYVHYTVMMNNIELWQFISVIGSF